MKQNYFLMVNGDYYSEGTFLEMKKEALKLSEEAKKGFLLPVSGELVKTIEICMFNIEVYNAI